MPSEFDNYLDFWLEGQREGFAGNLERIKLPNGSKMVTLYNSELRWLYVDHWYGADLGGGQTILYVAAEPWNPSSRIVGTPVARLGYSGQIIERFTPEEMEDIGKFFGDIPQSEVIWKELKAALSQVTPERPFRGPDWHEYPGFPHLYYSSNTQQNEDMSSAIIEEQIGFRKEEWCKTHFVGHADFTLIKKNLEDSLPIF